MRVILACRDAEAADAIAAALGGAGYSVVVLDEVSPTSPELRGAELLIADKEAAASIGDAGPARRLLVTPRGATVDLTAVQGRFADVLAFPVSSDEVVARVRHAVGR